MRIAPVGKTQVWIWYTLPQPIAVLWSPSESSLSVLLMECYLIVDSYKNIYIVLTTSQCFYTIIFNIWQLDKWMDDITGKLIFAWCPELQLTWENDGFDLLTTIHARPLSSVLMLYFYFYNIPTNIDIIPIWLIRRLKWKCYFGCQFVSIMWSLGFFYNPTHPQFSICKWRYWSTYLRVCISTFLA